MVIFHSYVNVYQRVPPEFRPFWLYVKKHRYTFGQDCPESPKALETSLAEHEPKDGTAGAGVSCIFIYGYIRGIQCVVIVRSSHFFGTHYWRPSQNVPMITMCSFHDTAIDFVASNAVPLRKWYRSQVLRDHIPWKQLRKLTILNDYSEMMRIRLVIF